MDTNYEIARIKLSSKLNKKAPPILATFSCGQLNDNSKIEFQGFKAKHLENLENNQAKKILMAQTKFLTYEGSSNDNPAKFSSQYFVGVRNKRNGKLKLYNSSFFHLKPKISHASRSTVESSPSTSSYWESRNKLTAAFGGKVSKRVLSSQLKFSVDVDSVEATQIEALSTPETLSLPENEPSQTYLPSMNREAASLDEVFNIHEIISPEDDCALEEQVDYFLETLESDPISAKANFHKFALHLLEIMVEDRQKLKLILYYNYMVIFQNLTYNDIRKKDPCPLIPEPFKQSLIEKFTAISRYDSGRSARVIPPKHRDKLVAYIFVLALFINNYCVNINHIIGDLKRVTPKQLTIMAQTLGCHVKSEKIDDQKEDKFAELRFPLQAPPLKFRKRIF